MRAPSANDIFLFGDFRLDWRGLFRRGENAATVPVEIGSRALDVLRVLVERPGDLLSRYEIMAAAWPGMLVDDNNLTIQIATLRRVLDQDGTEGSRIQTVPGRGYRFIAPVTRVEPRVRPLQPAPRLSIVVLPFTNLSDDREQQYFADGITGDLTTDLSRFENMFVFSRNTAFTFRNTPIGTTQIGRELGVRYVLDGSVQRSGKQVRVTAQLIDAATDAHVWTERFDREVGDLFAVQNEITGRIANALGVELIAAETARSSDDSDAPDYVLRGRAAGLKPASRGAHAEQISMYEQALTLDPRSVEAQSLLADALAHRVLDRLTDTAAADIARAVELADRVLAASPRSAAAHLAKGMVLRAQDRCEEAVPEYEAVLAINPNAARVLDALADCKLLTGSIEEVIPLAKQAIRLSPSDPRVGDFYFRIGHAHLLQSNHNAAISWLEKGSRVAPGLPFGRILLAAAYGLKGDINRAAAELAEARGLVAANRWSSVARLRAVGYWGVPKIRTLIEATYFAGLRKAGMSEE